MVFNPSGLPSRSGSLIIEGLNLCVRQEIFDFQFLEFPVAVKSKKGEKSRKNGENLHIEG